MSARKKLNGLYTGLAALVAAFVGLGFGSWAAFGVTFVLIMVFNTHTGNTRWAAGRRGW
ncbi:hypothetical protein J8F10_16490 [Gemmata sp. G18]|uniref:Phosphatidate cytidylyltransferase n=1 Tax=Gemmata palustris TaxID=2822762 RepID=A0ABS5BT36_9BACT|nr:hypothetical protein [Gemmata palustris]MBP3956871.1 hypothetical protein [Gemmata palustris]